MKILTFQRASDDPLSFDWTALGSAGSFTPSIEEEPIHWNECEQEDYELMEDIIHGVSPFLWTVNEAQVHMCTATPMFFLLYDSPQTDAECRWIWQAFHFEAGRFVKCTYAGVLSAGELFDSLGTAFDAAAKALYQRRNETARLRREG